MSNVVRSRWATPANARRGSSLPAQPINRGAGGHRRPRPRSAGDVFPVPAGDLLALGQSGERVRDRHLARFITLQPHLIENFTARKTMGLVDNPEQLFSP